MHFPGRFITLEGLDGSGKSTQFARAAEYLRAQGCRTVATREPGGTELGQRVRDLLLDSSAQTRILPHTELALMFAARAQHVEQVILPALRDGCVVLCDRFTDSSFAYQGYGRGISADTIGTLETIFCSGLKPNLTLLLDLDARTGAARTGHRSHQTLQPHTRFEREDLDFFDRVRQGYLAIARQEPQRVKIIDASPSVEQVWLAIRRVLDEHLDLGKGCS